MVRVSDARMSGTSFGTTVLHVSPEAADGGTLGLVESGDYISLDARAGVLHLEVDEAELARRRAVLDTAPAAPDSPVATSHFTTNTFYRPTRVRLRFPARSFQEPRSGAGGNADGLDRRLVNSMRSTN